MAKWKDNKKAVYLLSFDDEAPTQLEIAVPELIRRKIVGTFYVVTGSELWNATADQWTEVAKSPYVSLANHTFTHTGVTSAPDLNKELELSNQVLYRIYANRAQPFLLSFGRPGGVPWNVAPEEYSSALRRHNLIERPPFQGSPINFSSQDELVATVDQAINTGSLGYNDMHGIGGDWLATPVEWFSALLDRIESAEDELWVPDVITYNKYLDERQAASVSVKSASANRIDIELTTSLDSALYDYPLTLITRVPVGWTSVTVSQGGDSVGVPVQNGQVMYDAIPGAGEIHVLPQ